jgi:predicted nucleic acid-binding protein
LVSALIADGPPSRLIEEVIDGRIELVLPDIVVAELERVMEAKLGFEKRPRREVIRLLREISTHRPRTPRQIESITGDPGDDAILACAVKAKVDIVATGDHRHLRPLARHRGIRLMSPQAVLAELRARER